MEMESSKGRTVAEGQHLQVAVVGSGFAGIAAGIKLREAGFDDFLIFEKNEGLGGTWRDNSYPGCACDVESHLYSFSFAPNPEWSQSYSPQSEILAYLERTARDRGLMPRMRFGHRVERCAWQQDEGHWRLETSRGVFTADFVIGGPGGLSQPAIPTLQGLDRFQGETFHSARWNHGHSLRGKRVAVIGTGASALQFVPEIQPEVQSMRVFQRTPAWVLPRIERKISAKERARFRRFPILQKLERGVIYARRELLALGLNNPSLMKPVQKLAVAYLERKVKDPVLRAKLTPNFTIGCKRILLSRTYLPALVQDNVDVVTEGIREVTEDAILTEDGVRHEVDTIIFGTGFHVGTPAFSRAVHGIGGRSLADAWDGSPRAYLGATVSGFPNMFILGGPNTGLGHTSVVLMMESQLAMVIDALKHMRAQNLTQIDVRQEVMDGYVQELDSRAQGTVWSSGGCSSWYLDATGRNSTLWPGFTFSFMRRTRFRAQDYHLLPAVLRPVRDEPMMPELQSAASLPN